MKQRLSRTRSAARAPAILLVGTLLAGAPFAAVLAGERAAPAALASSADCPVARTCGETVALDVPELDSSQQAQLGELATRAALAESRAFSVLRALRQSSSFTTVPQRRDSADAAPAVEECPS